MSVKDAEYTCDVVPFLHVCARLIVSPICRGMHRPGLSLLILTPSLVQMLAIGVIVKGSERVSDPEFRGRFGGPTWG